MQYEANSIYFLAQVRHTEIQAEIEYYHSGRQREAVFPTFSELVIGTVSRVARGWAKASIARGPGIFPRRSVAMHHNPNIGTSRLV
ncbi:MAG: hypothetical protein U0031_03260 [Thermomicrobiales bacterium]